MQKKNDGLDSAQSGETVQSIFERKVQLDPEAPAVYGVDGTCWSYARLNLFANRIAHRLLSRGVTPEWRVGICMQRSPETIGVLLGILKTRAVYVPLDPKLPSERLRYIAQDAMIEEIFADAAGIAKLRAAAMDEIEVLTANADEDVRDESPNLPSSANDVATILYTSGSTGKPKGSMLEHRGILRLVTDTTWLTFSTDNVFLQISALSFDISIFEVWGPLLNGGSVVTVPQTPSIGEIEFLLERFKVTTLWLTAGLFNVVMDECPQAVRNIKHLLTGGDIASPRHARLALEHLKRGELLNCYGPTENTTFSTCHRVRFCDTEQPSVPIGSPVDKSCVYLLDDSMKPIHDLRVGEIFVGGEGLSRGYWNRPELDAEKFVKIEIEPDTVIRLYRTGDLGRYNNSKVLEFVGRTDFQVKIRGFRVEPEEIEIALSSMPGLAAAAVVARGTSAESKQLYCCYVRDGSADLKAGEIESFLKGKFPDYMLPSVFRELTSLPRNANEKVDRNALCQLFESSRTGQDLRKSANEIDALTPARGCASVQAVGVSSADEGFGGRFEKLIRQTTSVFSFTLRRRPPAPVSKNS